MCNLTDEMNKGGMNTRENDLRALRELKMAKKAIDDKIAQVEKKIMEDNLKVMDKFFDCFE
jgi:hypothetical protein